MKDYFFNQQQHKLVEKLLHILRSRGMALGCAESCTGGLLSSAITSIAGCSDVFMLSQITYANKAKARCLDIDIKEINTEGAVSAKIAIAMAIAITKQTTAISAQPTLGISTTGIAGPSTSIHKTVGLIFIATHQSNQSISQCQKYQFSGNRKHVRQKAVLTALDFAVTSLLNTNQ